MHHRLAHGRIVDSLMYDDLKESLFELTAQVGSPFCAEVRPASTLVIVKAMKLVFIFACE